MSVECGIIWSTPQREKGIPKRMKASPKTQTKFHTAKPGIYSGQDQMASDSYNKALITHRDEPIPIRIENHRRHLRISNALKCKSGANPYQYQYQYRSSRLAQVVDPM